MNKIKEDMGFISIWLNFLFSKFGHILILYPFDDNGENHFISNAKREDVIVVLRAAADSLESDQISKIP